MAALDGALPIVLGAITTNSAVDGNNPMAHLFDEQIEEAFVRAADLSRYEAGEVAGASRWVLHLGDNADASALASQLGAQHLTATDLIENTYIYALPAGASRQDIGARMQALPGVEYAYPLTMLEAKGAFVPNDPLYTQQWHLNNSGQNGGVPGEDASLEGAWDLNQGQGVVIAVVDDGVQYTHPDLASKYLVALGLDVVDGDADPMPDAVNGDFHGTAVAGVATAVTNNAVGSSGAAPDAELAAIRFLGGPVDDAGTAQVFIHENQIVDIYNNSWGYTAPYVQPGPLSLAALQQAVTAGRGGRGSILAFANGNDFQNSQDGNYAAFQNSWWTLAIGALDHRGGHSYYSTPGANLLISAPSNSGQSGVVTTDLVGNEGYNSIVGGIDGDTLTDLNYTSTFGGTSSATPLVSGIIALMLAENPNLTWRDVQHILVRTARKNDAANIGWATNGAGHHVNHLYGFGAIDAQAAVQMASTWTNVAAAQVFQTTSVAVNQPIPDGNSSLTVSFDITNDVRLEQIELQVDLTHDFPEDLEIVLQSPDGTESVLSRTRTEQFSGAFSGALEGWSFTSTRHWDELVKGTWTITFRDQVAGDQGTLNNFQFNFIDTATTAQPTGGTIQGQVFGDSNSNGAFEASENPLAGVKVYLDTNGNNVPDAGERTTISNTAGYYTFRGLIAGNYIVDVAPNAVQAQTSPGSYNVTLAANQAVIDRDFGVRPALTSNGPHILSNGNGDGTVTVGVDGYGSFGSAVSPLTTDAIYDPIGGISSSGTTFESGVAIGLGQGARDILSTGMNIPSAGFFPNPQVSGDNQLATSSFVYGNLLFELQQTLSPLNDTNGNRIGSQLKQTYRITNIGTETTNFDLVRYIDGDLTFDGSLIDGGGRLLVNNSEIMFETDTAAGTADATTFVGITATGGSHSAISRYEADAYSGLLQRIINGSYLNQTITNDGPDADQFVDIGQGYDITLALQNVFVVDPGQVAVYETTTLFGSGAPSEIVQPPPPPPPPLIVSGVVTNDSNSNGTQDSSEPGIPNVLVYLDLNGDGKLGIGEASQATNKYGQFQFTVAAGNYTVRQVDVPGWERTGGTHVHNVSGEAGDSIGGLFFGNRALVDYGDAPSPFPTLASQGGPSHNVVPGMFLGAALSGEADGHPDSVSDYDLHDDGVTFVSSLVTGSTATVRVDVHNGGQPAGMLHAWVDFNGDGDWNDAGERIFSNQRVSEGANYLTFAVPSGAQMGRTYARFRYGYGNAVGPTGAMLGGEVEDYRVIVAGQQLVANADHYSIPVNSPSTFDVLVNDVQGPGGPLNVIAISTSQLGATIVRNPDQTIRYTPHSIGRDTLTYTITDFQGNFSTAQVTIDVGQPVYPAVAIDDVYTVGRNSVANFLPVVDNDRLHSPYASVSVAQATSNGGYVAVNEATGSLRYTPPFNFTGIDQFQYTLRDQQGTESTGNITVYVGGDRIVDLARLEVQVSDLTGAPVTEITVGSQFLVQVYVRDLRVDPTDPGVVAAYLDLLYGDGVTPAPLPGNAIQLMFNPEFDLARQVSSQTGVLNEVGAARAAPEGTSERELLFTVTFNAFSAGLVEFTTDPAEGAQSVRLDSPLQSLSIGQVDYGTASLMVLPVQTVAPTSVKNLINAYDVNADNVVSPLDALLIINQLNSRSEGPSGQKSTTVFLDVNGDNFLTPLDALLIVNHLNAGGKAQGEGVAVEPTTEAGALPDAGATKHAMDAQSWAALYPWNDVFEVKKPLSVGGSDAVSDDDDQDGVELFAEDVANAWR